jgi:hypothetical protein
MDGVVAGAAEQGVLAVIAVDVVVAAVAVHQVVAAVAGKRIVAGEPVDRVVVGVADEGKEESHVRSLSLLEEVPARGWGTCRPE